MEAEEGEEKGGGRDGGRRLVIPGGAVTLCSIGCDSYNEWWRGIM